MVMKQTSWAIFTDTSSTDKAVKVCNAVKKKIPYPQSDTVVADYPKGGHRCTFTTDAPAGDAASQVVAVISTAQQLGYGWSLYGDIEEEFSLWSNQSSLPGITAIEIQCD